MCLHNRETKYKEYSEKGEMASEVGTWESLRKEIYI